MSKLIAEVMAEDGSRVAEANGGLVNDECEVTKAMVLC